MGELSLLTLIAIQKGLILCDEQLNVWICTFTQFNPHLKPFSTKILSAIICHPQVSVTCRNFSNTLTCDSSSEPVCYRLCLLGTMRCDALIKHCSPCVSIPK